MIVNNMTHSSGTYQIICGGVHKFKKQKINYSNTSCCLISLFISKHYFVHVFRKIHHLFASMRCFRAALTLSRSGMTTYALLVRFASSKTKFNPVGDFPPVALRLSIHPSHDNITRAFELSAASQSTHRVHHFAPSSPFIGRNALRGLQRIATCLRPAGRLKQT
jgi:hypothetical protein